MRIFIFILSIFILQSCSKPKTVLICGDHVCVNNKEAEQYFKENLSLEVKVIDNKKAKEDNLVELNRLTKFKSDFLKSSCIKLSNCLNCNFTAALTPVSFATSENSSIIYLACSTLP